jgi:hypothetical protein
MPGRSGDYDAGGMVWGSMIDKKLFGGSGLPTGPSFRAGRPVGQCSGSIGPRAIRCLRSLANADWSPAPLEYVYVDYLAGR